MAKTWGRGWTWGPSKRLKPDVPDGLKADVAAKADELVATSLVPRFVKPPPKDPRWNYLTGIKTKWHGSFFYFIGEWASPGPNALSPGFESGFARLEYVGGGRFNTAYMRHTGKWWELYTGLTLDECLKTVRDEGHFYPPV
jgi:hypothetical protein